MIDPRKWTPEQREDVAAFGECFGTEAGRRVLRVLRRDIYDQPSAFAEDADGRLVLLDDRSTVANEGRRSAFVALLGYLESYDVMIGQPEPGKGWKHDDSSNADRDPDTRSPRSTGRRRREVKPPA